MAAPNFDEVHVGQIINVQAYKHDGTLYRQWNGVKIIDHASSAIVALMVKTKVLEATGHRWTVREPILWFFDKVNCYNTTALIKPDGILYYTNLASPPVFENSTIKFIDYDLDLKAYPNKKLQLVDKKEYQTNGLKYGYSPYLKKLINQTTQQVSRLINNELGFFNPQLMARYIEMLIQTKQIKADLTFDET